MRAVFKSPVGVVGFQDGVEMAVDGQLDLVPKGTPMRVELPESFREWAKALLMQNS